MAEKRWSGLSPTTRRGLGARCIWSLWPGRVHDRRFCARVAPPDRLVRTSGRHAQIRSHDRPGWSSTVTDECHTWCVDVAAYLAVRDRVTALVIGADGASVVPACPEWTLRDVVAHLCGLCEDWVARRLDGYASEEWTSRQVARFANTPLEDILERWHSAGAAFASLADDPLMGPPGRWAFGDAVVHEADLRGAVDGTRVPQAVVALALKGAIGRWRRLLADAGAPSLLVRAEGLRDWKIEGARDAKTVTVTAPAYELFRALAGRRSAGQVRNWDWSDDPSPYIDAGLPYPFCWARAALTD